MPVTTPSGRRVGTGTDDIADVEQIDFPTRTKTTPPSGFGRLRFDGSTMQLTLDTGSEVDLGGGGGGGGETLAQTLALGNTTGANEITVSSGQGVTFTNGQTVQVAPAAQTTGPGTLNIPDLGGGTDTIAGLAADQTFTNKNFTDSLFIGTATTHTNVPLGTVIDMAASGDTDLAFVLKSSSTVAHGMTTGPVNVDAVEVDDFFALGKTSNTEGGVNMLSLGDQIASAFQIRGHIRTSSGDTAKVVGCRAGTEVYLTGHDGANTQEVIDASAINVFGVRGHRTGAPNTDEMFFIVDSQGGVHADGDYVAGLGDGSTTAVTGNTVRAPDLTTGGAGNVAGADLTIGSGLGTGTGDVGKIIFDTPRVATAGDNLQSRSTAMVIDGGMVGIGEENPTGTLHLHTGAGSNPLQRFSDGDVTHGMTSLFPNNVFGELTVISGGAGGALLQGISDANTTPGLSLRGYVGDTSVGNTAIEFRAARKTGTTAENVGVGEIAFSFENNDNSALMTINGAGTVTTTSLSLTNALGETDGGTGTDTYATGDVLYASAANTLSKLAAGSDGEVLTLASGVPSWAAATGGAPTGAQYVTLATDAGLSAERVLTGTTDQINLSDGGANGNITLSTPQDIATTSSVQFGNTTLGTGGALRTATSAGNTALLQAYDVDGAAYTTFATLTANNTPTMDLAAAVTYNGSTINDANALSGSTLASGVTASSLTSVGTLTSLTMGGDINMGDSNRTLTVGTGATNRTLTLSNSGAGVANLDIDGGLTLGTQLGATEGGTAQSTWTTGDIMFASASNTLSRLAAGADGFVLTMSSGTPSWAAAAGGGGGILPNSGGATRLTFTPASTAEVRDIFDGGVHQTDGTDDRAPAFFDAGWATDAYAKALVDIDLSTMVSGDVVDVVFTKEVQASGTFEQLTAVQYSGAQTDVIKQFEIECNTGLEIRATLQWSTAATSPGAVNVAFSALGAEA